MMDQAWENLSKVIDPEIGVSIMELNLVQKLEISVPRTSPTLSGHLGIETLKIFMPDHGYDIGYQVIQDRG